MHCESLESIIPVLFSHLGYGEKIIGDREFFDAFLLLIPQPEISIPVQPIYNGQP
jgi:hypothetical protein